MPIRTNTTNQTELIKFLVTANSQNLVFTNNAVYNLYINPTNKSNSSLIKIHPNLTFNFQDVKMVDNNRVFFIAKDNHLYYVKNMSEKWCPEKLTVDPMMEPEFLTTNGDFTIIRFNDPYAGFGYLLFNKKVMDVGYEQTRLFFNQSFSKAISIYNSVIFFNNDAYMFYKTDFGGFMRTGVFEADMLLAILYKLSWDSRSFLIFKNIDGYINLSGHEVTDYSLECQPRKRGLRLVSEVFEATFSTVDQDSSLADEYVYHKIVWEVSIGKLGYAAWTVLTIISIIGMIIGIFQCFRFRTDSKMLKKLKEQQVTEALLRQREAEERMRTINKKPVDQYIDLSITESSSRKENCGFEGFAGGGGGVEISRRWTTESVVNLPAGRLFGKRGGFFGRRQFLKKYASVVVPETIEGESAEE